MKVQLESTSDVVEMVTESGETVPARVWVGHSESGVQVHAYITRIRVDADADQTQFDELLACPQTSLSATIPGRIVL